MTNNFSVAVAVISSSSPPQTAAPLFSHPGGYIHRRCCHFEHSRLPASRSKANSRGTKASAQFAERTTQHRKQNSSRANCQTRTQANNAECSRQKRRATESPESPACQPYRTPNESDQSWGSRCCFHGDWMHHRSSSQDPPGSPGLAELMDDSSGMRESWSSPCLSLSTGEK